MSATKSTKKRKAGKVTSRVDIETSDSIVFDMGELFDAWLRVEERSGGVFVDHVAFDHQMILSRKHALHLASRLIEWASKDK